MRKMTKISSAVMLMVFCLALPQAYGGMMEHKASGMLMGAGDHKASGHAEITQDVNGKLMLLLHLTAVDKVPDGRIYLAKDADYTKGVELGKLNKFKGIVEYPIPTGVNPQDYNSVVIWCKKFNVEIGHAMFEKGMMEKRE